MGLFSDTNTKVERCTSCNGAGYYESYDNDWGAYNKECSACGGGEYIHGFWNTKVAFGSGRVKNTYNKDGKLIKSEPYGSSKGSRKI